MLHRWLLSYSLSFQLFEKLNTKYLILHSISAILQVTPQTFSQKYSTCEVLAPHIPTLTKYPYSSGSYYHSPTSLFIHYSFILQISTAFTTSLSPPIPLLLSSIPTSRALQTSIPFPTSQIHCASHHLHPRHSLANILDSLASAQENRISKRREEYSVLWGKGERNNVSEAAHCPLKVMLPWIQNRIIAGRQLSHLELYFQHALPHPNVSMWSFHSENVSGSDISFLGQDC